MAYSYREVLKEPRALGVFGAALLGRLSFAMGPLSLVLFVRAATGSFAVAGAASAATALTSGLFAPVRGRMVDRYGQPRTLPPLSLLYAAAFVGVLLLASAGRAGEAAAVLLSGVAGAAAPPLAASMRVLWSALVGGGPRLQTAFALDTVVEGVLFTLGPLLASGLAAAFAPAAALAAVAALAVVGTLAFISSPVSKGWIPTVGEGRAGWAGAMSGRGIRTLVISLTGFGAAVGIIDITLVAAARQAGSASLGGVLLAMLALLALVSAALPLARPLPLLGLVVVAVGLLLSPLQSCAYVLAAELAPAGTMTEAATWVITANNVTAAAGIALAGVLVGGPGVAWTLVVSWGCMAAAFLAALVGRGTLLPSGSVAQQGTTEAS